MLNRLPVEINPFRLVEQKKQLTGIIPLKQLSRLSEIALPSSEDIAVKLDFTRTQSGLALIEGYIRGQILLECQRCLQPLPYTLDHPLRVALTTFQSDERPEQEGLEAWLVEDDRLFVLDFVEDEILLALPLVAKHEQCEPVRPLIEALPTDIPATTSGQEDKTLTSKSNPFAVLKDWKKTE